LFPHKKGSKYQLEILTTSWYFFCFNAGKLYPVVKKMANGVATDLKNKNKPIS
jgi:hypothetical protein